MKKAIGIIPARFASTRFPGKPLVKILDKTLLQRTFERASLCKELSKVIVATDDERILRHVREFGGEAVLTSLECANGTERIFEAINKKAEYQEYEFIVNVQGSFYGLTLHLQLLINFDSNNLVHTALLHLPFLINQHF